MCYIGGMDVPAGTDAGLQEVINAFLEGKLTEPQAERLARCDAATLKYVMLTTSARIAELTEQVRVACELMSQLQAQVRQLQEEVRELRRRLNTNSSNSSLPPSANPPSAPKPTGKPPTGRKPGGQPGHPGHYRTRLPPERVKEIVPYVPAACERCQGPLPHEASGSEPEPTWHQVVELPKDLAVVTEYQGHARTCPSCGHTTWGKIPPEVLAHGYGPKLTGTLAYLSGSCHDSKRTVQEVAQTLLGVPLSLGSVVRCEQEVSAALKAPYAEAEQAVREAPAKNADETGWSLGGDLCWLWLAATSGVAYFKIHARRSQEALRALLGTTIQGVVTSDRWGVYGIVELLRRQVCWAHLKRDFQKWLEWGGETASIGQAGLEAVKKVFALWRDYKEGVLDRPGLAAALGPVSMDLQGALQAGLSCSVKKAARFCGNVLAVYPALWTFSRLEGVEPTNNHAERTLRIAVIWRKISFGNWSEAGCRFAERILTTVQTLRLQKRDVLAYLRQAVVAHRSAQPAPSLVGARA
jgi:transposase